MNIKQTKRGVVLSENACYASIRVTKYAKSKTDRARSREIEIANNASRGSVKMQTSIFSKNFDAKVSAVESEIRANHYTFTFEVPTEGGKQSRGARLLATKVAERYIGMQMDAIARYNHEADAVVQDYEDMIEREKSRLGDLFDESKYPHPDVVRASYSADVFTDAIPSVEGINVGQYTDSQRAKAEQRQRDAVENVTRELLERLREGTSKIREKMDKIIVDPKGTRIHDSIFDSVRELVNDVIPACNIEGSKELVTLADEVRKLTRFNTEAVRTTSSAQQAIAKEAKAIEDKFNEYF